MTPIYVVATNSPSFKDEVMVAMIEANINMLRKNNLRLPVDVTGAMVTYNHAQDDEVRNLHLYIQKIII